MIDINFNEKSIALLLGLGIVSLYFLRNKIKDAVVAPISTANEAIDNLLETPIDYTVTYGTGIIEAPFNVYSNLKNRFLFLLGVNSDEL